MFHQVCSHTAKLIRFFKVTMVSLSVGLLGEYEGLRARNIGGLHKDLLHRLFIIAKKRGPIVDLKQEVGLKLSFLGFCKDCVGVF